MKACCFPGACSALFILEMMQSNRWAYICLARASLALTALFLGSGFTSVSAVRTILRWHSQRTSASAFTTNSSQKRAKCGSASCRRGRQL